MLTACLMTAKRLCIEAAYNRSFLVYFVRLKFVWGAAARHFLRQFFCTRIFKSQRPPAIYLIYLTVRGEASPFWIGKRLNV